MDHLGLGCIWVVKERLVYPISKRVEWREVLTRKNSFTNYGLTALASAPGGSYSPPAWLAIDPTSATFTTSVNPGATSITLNGRIDLAGDTQLVLSPGLPAQETVTFTGESTPDGGVTYVYQLSQGCANAHAAGDFATRLPGANDTIASFTEAAYDATNFPGQRPQSTAGFSPAAGQWTMQYYFTGLSAPVNFMTVRLVDSPTIGQGNVHNGAVLGYNYTDLSNDLEIDGTLSLVNLS